jgi:hypothetical protein
LLTLERTGKVEDQTSNGKDKDKEKDQPEKKSEEHEDPPSI